MTARVLVVDDIPANVKLLQARLEAEYFEVLTASSGFEALEICAATPPDIVLLDVMMPGMNGFQVCQHLKSNPETHHIPIIMVTALDQQSDKVRGLDVGADDFLSKPINNLALFTRVRSLVRIKVMQDELRTRAMMAKRLNNNDPIKEIMNETGRNGHILLVEDRINAAERIEHYLTQEHTVEIETNPLNALIRANEKNFDLVMISMLLRDFDTLRLCSQIRSVEKIRQLPILLISEPELEAKILQGMEMGVNDYINRPIDSQELLTRVRAQVKRKRYSEKLRDKVNESIELALVDGLTGLKNRRYMEQYAPSMIQQANISLKPFSILMLDIDHFKMVNDTYGHNAGDEVLREFARRIKSSVRNIDMAIRLGGEEFVVVMPDADSDIASATAERLREKVAAEPFLIHQGAEAIDITVSIGFANRISTKETIETLVTRADEAVYHAKRSGRNCVIYAKAA